MQRNVTVLVGTTKGVFLIDPSEGRWTVRGPFCDGWSINHVVGDPQTGTIWAAGGGEWTGAGVWRSSDGGTSWTVSRLSTGKFDDWLAADPDFAAQIGRAPAPPAPFTGEVENLWSLGLSGTTLYTGAKPAALFFEHIEIDGCLQPRFARLADTPAA